MVSDRLLSTVRCPDCRQPVLRNEQGLQCQGCGRTIPQRDATFLDLRPALVFEEQTKYLDDALHADARQERVSPPLLAAGVRNRMLRSMLKPSAGDAVIDLGCGSGRMMLWNRTPGAWSVGVDVSPFFALESRDAADLVLGDLRRLPFADATFTKGYCLDVLEHLSPSALREMLGETARVMAPGGRLFLYSHVRKNSSLALGLRGVNALARRLETLGLLDMTHERLRKSDHQNPLADIPELEAVVGDAGFTVRQLRYYTPLIGGVVENILLRVAERWLVRRRTRSLSRDLNAPGAESAALRDTRAAAKATLARGGVLLWTLRALTWMMHMDVMLFGRVRSGPFFALLERTARPPAIRSADATGRIG
ncbi:MAG: methyltransferase domain-containing protein [Vicinamibacterales bacterium]